MDALLDLTWVIEGKAESQSSQCRQLLVLGGILWAGVK